MKIEIGGSCVVPVSGVYYIQKEGENGGKTTWCYRLPVWVSALEIVRSAVSIAVESDRCRKGDLYEVETTARLRVQIVVKQIR